MVDLASVIASGETGAWEKQNASFLQNRIIILDNEIDVPQVRDVTAWILQWNLEDVLLSKKDRTPITILIHSDGGDPFVAGNVIDAIRCSETPIRVVALGCVASAAYFIYVSAPERYAFKNSVFLQHDGGVQITNSNNKAKDIMNFLDRVDERMKELVIENTDITKDLYEENEDREWWMYADEAKELGIVQKIIGEDISLKQLFK